MTRPLVVLHALRPPDGTTKYVDQLVGGASSGLRLEFFSWRRALIAEYDVLHVHWPELLVRARQPLKAWVKRRALECLLIRVKIRRIPLVWTAHNLEPHETGTPAERRSLKKFREAVDLTIRLNPTTEVASGSAVATILHGHYIDQYASYERADSVPGRVLYFGIIRPYKGVAGLMDAFAELSDLTATLRIVGEPHPGQREIIEARLDRDPRASATLRFVEDHELAEELGHAELVVLPYRERMHNSGALLMALSLDRPVLVPASPTNAALSDEVGPGWVLEYDGKLTSEILSDALERVHHRASAVPPVLAGRDWSEVGRLHEAAYRSAVRTVRGET